MSTCYKSSNNKHFNAPPRMSDGRHFTDYRPSFELNKKISDDNELGDSYTYRQFLIDNAEQLMDINKKHSFMMNGNTECVQPFAQGTMLPEAQKMVCDMKSCKVVDNYENGIGMGRVYTQDPNASCLAPLTEPEMKTSGNLCAPNSDLGNYYPVSNEAVDNAARVAIPGGGEVLSGGDPNVVA